MYIILLRAVILYVLIIFSMRLMGKRQIGQLQPMELVVALILSEIAATPMQDTKIPMLMAIIPIITITFLQILLSFFQTKSNFLSTLIDGRPSILISNGAINEKILRKQRITFNEIFEEMRINNVSDIREVVYAILETNGKISMLTKNTFKTDQNKKNKKSNSKTKNNEISLPTILISNGSLNEIALRKRNLDLLWLMSKLQSNGINSIEETYIAYLDYNGNLYSQKKES